MKVATWNINGVVRRLPLLLDWLARARPDVVALQETKATDAEFPEGRARRRRLRRDHRRPAALERRGAPGRGAEPIVVRRALPGDAGDTQARYLEAAIGGILFASIYLPNGNPRPGPKFAYKLAWFERLIAHAASLQASGHPVVLAGDFNVVPTESDIYPTTSYRDNALLQPEPREAYHAAAASRAGPMRSVPAIPRRRSTPSGTTCATAGRATPGCASTTCC